MLTKANPPDWKPHQKRFLSAYREGPEISRAARLAGIHRATVYRWKIDPAFAEAMRSACDAFFHEHRAKIITEEESRRQWRKERERARHPMRCHYLALAREAKRR